MNDKTLIKAMLMSKEHFLSQKLPLSAVNIMDAIARIEELKLFIESLRKGHHMCEDPFYSCPKSKDFQETEEAKCDCGADCINAEIDRILEK